MNGRHSYQDEKCYACGRLFRRNTYGRVVFHPQVLTSDGQRQCVGYDCYGKVVRAGADGYQPSLGGPRLYAESTAPSAVLEAAGIVYMRHSIEERTR